MNIIDSSGKVVIKKGEVGTIVLHKVENLENHRLVADYVITSDIGGIVGIRHILLDDVLIFLVVSSETGRCVPAPCNIEILWRVSNVRA
jgi:hypothetical protein